MRLRAREPGDAEIVQGWLDPDVVHFNEARYPWSLAETRKRSGEGSEPSYAHARFAVERKDSGLVIGDIAIHESSPENRAGWLALVFGPDSRGQGYGSEALRIVCRFAFEMMNLNRLELEYVASNARARRVYEKVGFREEGTRRDAYFTFGRYEDAVVMGLLRNEFCFAPAPRPARGGS